ncbi:MAG: hypothetical protein A2428_03100 [Bdellovibrionales bacterium RIFOXYC1_FULL_54_43]|nr:MAG: hypothetical protein A2428_03100 [Bdellovibrionales bacterium RIFOXYC1_FULL_54_43]OFZ82668.1 MAG: hypothetical protein A2603_02535 [Bdellovibrionales bacterium RIFOXYD1_FULL_55_31]
MKNYVQPGDVIEFTAGADYLSGDPVVIGEMVGICTGDVANTTVGRAILSGVFQVVKAAGATWSKGQKLFWDKTNKNFTPTASSDADLLAGYAFESALLAATVGYIKLMGPGVAKVIPAIAAHGAPAVTATVIAGSNLVAVNAAEPTKAEVDTGIDTLKTAVVTALDLKADNADLVTVAAKLDAVIAALKVAGLMDN